MARYLIQIAYPEDIATHGREAKDIWRVFYAATPKNTLFGALKEHYFCSTYIWDYPQSDQPTFRIYDTKAGKAVEL